MSLCMKEYVSKLTLRIRINAVGDGVEGLISVVVELGWHFIVVIRIVHDATTFVKRIEFVIVLVVGIKVFVAHIFDVIEFLDIVVAIVMVLLSIVVTMLSMVFGERWQNFRTMAMFGHAAGHRFGVIACRIIAQHIVHVLIVAVAIVIIVFDANVTETVLRVERLNQMLGYWWPCCDIRRL